MSKIANSTAVWEIDHSI